MKNVTLTASRPGGIGREELQLALRDFLASAKAPSRVLLLPPDYTRFPSRAGLITSILYELLSPACRVDVMPCLGSHAPVSEEEAREMFPGIPHESLIVHSWRHDTVRIGTIPKEFVAEVSEGLVNEEIPVEVNGRIMLGGYDLILSIGQVVPHEVAGMANRTKNIFVGAGGNGMISATHMLGAFYGLERIMGRPDTPVRKVFDYAEDHFLKDVPLSYILTVATDDALHGVFMGDGKDQFYAASRLAAEKNMILLDRPIKKCVVYLDEREFKSTWLGNKSVYRTRMAMAEGGELIVLAPGIEKFGEDWDCDRLIRSYGYRGREATLAAVKEHADLAGNLSAAAHLIHGSPDGRFTVTYCTVKMPESEIRAVGYDWMPCADVMTKYNPETLTDGWNTVGGEEIYYISNPALGLWAERARMN